MRDKKEPIFSIGECESILSTFSTPSMKMIKKEGKLASYVRSLPFLPRSLSPMLKKGLEPVENEEGPRIFL
ncbi:hypothetical protein EUGRSUZ_F02904 [Eucalyptus grandis]|uniref:Uncharacterized protein n=2 Tax=Eucalyptus grandis TaxID=71139 RepID=A0ACC3KJE6_EUCGR|nr:hypothetical protein EUGRSUZ_F02904 [Eucalyptus grandis]